MEILPGLLREDIAMQSDGFCIAMSVDGVIAAGMVDGNVAILSPSGNKVPKYLQWRANLVRSLAFSDDGTVLYSGSDNNTVQAHNTTTWECLWTVNLENSSLFIVIFSNNIAVGGDSSCVSILDASNGDIISKMTTIRDYALDACLIPGEIDKINIDIVNSSNTI